MNTNEGQEHYEQDWTKHKDRGTQTLQHIFIQELFFFSSIDDKLLKYNLIALTTMSKMNAL